MHIAISAHLSQSMGADLSGQHGMSPVMLIWGALAAAATTTLAASGAVMSPTIRKIASSRENTIERFTGTKYHKRTTIKRGSRSRVRSLSVLSGVITGLVPVIHALLAISGEKDVDGRVKPGHDESWI